MGVHYARGLIGRIRAAKLTPVTLAVGSEIVWQGGVTIGEQLAILATIQEMERRHPLSALPVGKDDDHTDDDTMVLLTPPAGSAKSPVDTRPVPAAPAKVPSANGAVSHAAPTK